MTLQNHGPGATAEARKDWQDFLTLDFPHDIKVPVLNSTTDLGCVTHCTNHHLGSPQIAQFNAANGSDGLKQTFCRRPVAKEFLQAVVNHVGPAVGPAGALARYLNLVGWSLSHDGCLALDGYLSVSLRHDSLRHRKGIVL